MNNSSKSALADSLFYTPQHNTKTGKNENAKISHTIERSKQNSKCARSFGVRQHITSTSTFAEVRFTRGILSSPVPSLNSTNCCTWMGDGRDTRMGGERADEKQVCCGRDIRFVDLGSRRRNGYHCVVWRCTYHAQALLFVQTQFAQHLVALLHHQRAFVRVRRNVAVHLCASELISRVSPGARR